MKSTDQKKLEAYYEKAREVLLMALRCENAPEDIVQDLENASHGQIACACVMLTCELYVSILKQS